MTIKLSAKELICIASALGVTQVFGISDPFVDVPPRKLQKELDKVRQTLEDKGVLMSDFDGNVEINPLYLPLVETVVKCDACAVAETQCAGTTTQLMYYQKAERFVQCVVNGEELALKETTAVNASSDLSNIVNWTINPEQLDMSPCKIPQSLFVMLKGKSERVRKAEIEKLNMPQEIADILLDALRFKTNFYSLCYIDMISTGSVRSLMFIDDLNGTLKLTNIVENNKNYVLLSPVSQAELKQAVGAFSAIMRSKES